MTEPITTTTAAIAAAKGTSAASGIVSTTIPVSPTATIAAPAIDKTAVLHNLARGMLYRSEMTVLDQSELVDEFAAPIYSGLAAALPSPSNSSKTVMKDTVSAQTDKGVGAEGFELSEGLKLEAQKGPIIDVSGERSSQTVFRPTAGLVSRPPIPERLPPEIDTLLIKYYEAPTIESQLKTGAQKIVVERNLLDQKVVENDSKKTAICWVEERVIDRKYLDHGNLTDMISQIRHGHVPTIRQIYLAMIDLTDLATFKLFKEYLLKYKLESSQWRVRQLSADVEKKTIDGGLPKTEKRQFHIGREIKKRPWYTTDHVTELNEHVDTEVKKQMDLVVLNVQDVCTVDMAHTDYAKLDKGQNKFTAIFDASDQIFRMENNLPPEKIAKINKQAMVWTRENILTTTKQYIAEDHFHRYGCDLKKLLGNKHTESDQNVTIDKQSVYSEYLSPDEVVNFDDINTFDDATATFDKLHNTATIHSDKQIIENYVEQGKGVEFQDGWITYVPGGSIANLALKSDLGAKLNTWDWIWAGIDVATIALAIVTWGGSSAIGTAGKVATSVGNGVVKAGAKAVGKAAVRGTVKVTSKAGAKAAARVVGKSAVKAGAKASAGNIVKQTGKVTLRKVGAKAAKTAAKKSAKVAAKVATNTGLKPNTVYIRNGYKYFTDAQGRVIKATGKLKNVPGVRNNANQKLARILGKIGDEGGHLIPAAYGGPGAMVNHVPQTRTVNRSIIKRIENEMGRALKAGHKVEYTVMPHYPKNVNTFRPDKFTIRYKIDGIQKIRRIPNV